VVLVNGVNGHPSNWAQLVERTGCAEGMSHMCFRPSAANAKKATFAGIDVCGDRLVSELRGIVGSQQYSFTEISFIGHSMGGLVARCAATQPN
jgi:pimeloyl-ACP methyl ester carboxylesterase